MEFFKVPCPGKGKVSIDQRYQGENKDNESLHVFLCSEGNHDISMACLVGKTCQETVQRIPLSNTNPIDPPEVTFTCAR